MIDIMKKILAKAQKGGFDFPVDDFMDNLQKEAENAGITTLSVGMMLPIIYSHGFAKGYWGSELVMEQENGQILKSTPAWKWHLCQMVLSEDPVSYVIKFI